MDSQPDLDRLLRRCAKGDSAAFEQLYRATSAHLYALLRRMLTRDELAEEVLQDVFVSVWRKADSYDGSRGKPMTWLISIARNRALDVLRRRGREVLIDGEVDSVAELDQLTPAKGDESVQVGEIARCLKELSLEQRNSLLLSYYSGYTHEELAQSMRSPLGTVKSWIRRGLMSLRECLDRPGAADSEVQR